MIHKTFMFNSVFITLTLILIHESLRYGMCQSLCYLLPCNFCDNMFHTTRLSHDHNWHFNWPPKYLMGDVQGAATVRKYCKNWLGKSESYMRSDIIYMEYLCNTIQGWKRMGLQNHIYWLSMYCRSLLPLIGYI